MTHTLELEMFDVWGIDFMGLFMSSYGIKYILVVVDDDLNGWKQLKSLSINEKVSLLF